MRTRLSAGITILTLAAACVAPTTVQRGITPDQIRREEAKQREFVITGDLAQERRLQNLAYAMLRDARSMCGAATAPRLGLRATTVSTFGAEWRVAAATVGISDSLTITSVASESPAEVASIVPGDRIVTLDGRAVPAGTAGVKDFSERLPKLLARTGGQAEIGLVRDGARRDVILVADTLCDYEATVVRNETLNAFADGRGVYVHAGMMHMLSDDELATVFAHEVAHNSMKHIQAKQQNIALGAIFGAILDIAAASQGVNTGGEFTSQFAQLGAMTFSQDFEREADYVGMYILAAAGRPLQRAPNLWRRMAQASPGSIKFASSHPTTAERYVRLEQTAIEISEKQSAGVALLPETKQRQSSKRTEVVRAAQPGKVVVVAGLDGGPRPVRVPRSAESAPQPSSVPTAATSERPPAAATPVKNVSRPNTFVASRADRVFFLAQCAAAQELAQLNRNEFNSEQDALAAGYRPSQVASCRVDQTADAPGADSRRSNTPFVGSRVDRVFFLSNCGAARDLADFNTRRFATEKDATDAGYRRSRVVGC